MGEVLILPETTKYPITLIGEVASICQNKHNPDDWEGNYKRGFACLDAEHGRTWEYPTVMMILKGYSARVIREWYTHVGGSPSRLQASTRYVDYNYFDYVTPSQIADNPEWYEVYKNTMKEIQRNTDKLIDMGAKREDVANLYPLGMTTTIVDKRNLRNLVDMAHQRMCTKAYWEYRELFADIGRALIDYSEEWAYIVNTLFVPKCIYLGECKEKKSCGFVHEVYKNA